MIKISIKFNIGDKKTYYQEIIKDRKKKRLWEPLFKARYCIVSNEMLTT